MSDGNSTKTGVYCWRCTVNEKRYVGSAARSLVFRERVHRATLRGGYHGNRYLQAAWNKHGEAAFVFEVLEPCSPVACLAREQHWIDHFKSANRRFGYNLTPTAGSLFGHKFTAKQRARFSAAKKGKVFSAAHRAALSAGRKGMKFSPKHRANIGKSKKGQPCWAKGKKLSPEHCAKISAGKKGSRAWNKGKALSAKHRRKLKAAWKERKRKFGNVGMPNPAEVIARRAKSHKGKIAGERHPNHKLTELIVRDIRRRIALGESQTSIARSLNVHSGTINRVHAGTRWGWLI